MSLSKSIMQSETAARLKHWGSIVLSIVLVFVLIIAALKIYRILKRPANAKYIKGGGALPPGWDPKPLTDELYKTMDGISGSNQNDTVFGKFNDLNDNQMIAVYNDWNKDYSTKSVMWGLGGTWGTLTQAVKDESAYISIGTNERDIMLANLERLQLP